MPVNTSDYLLANGHPEDVVLVEAGRAVTYAELQATSAGLAARLAALGLPPGSRVGIVGPNSLFWVAAYLAVMKLGHVAVPFSDRLPAADAERKSAWVGCAAVFLDHRQRRSLASAFADPMPVITDQTPAGPRTSYWPEDAGTDPDADAVLMFTSGSTSGPKAVRVTHRNIQANTDSIVEYLSLQREDRMLVVLPFFYCFGASLLHTHLRVGGSLALCNSFVFPETAIDMLERERCTGFAGVPSSFQLLLRISSFGSRPLPTLRLVQQAGGDLPPVLIEELLAAQPRAELFVMYGQTEATARLSYLPPDRVTDRLGSIGRGIPGVELRVVDERGERVAPGVVGEIVARGANVSPGYWRDPETSAAKFPGGELRTGDLAYADERGLLLRRRSAGRLHQVVGPPDLQPGRRGGRPRDDRPRVRRGDRRTRPAGRRGGRARRDEAARRRRHRGGRPGVRPGPAAQAHGARVRAPRPVHPAHREREGRQAGAAPDRR